MFNFKRESSLMFIVDLNIIHNQCFHFIEKCRLMINVIIKYGIWWYIMLMRIYTQLYHYALTC